MNVPPLEKQTQVISALTEGLFDPLRTERLY